MSLRYNWCQSGLRWPRLALVWLRQKPTPLAGPRHVEAVSRPGHGDIQQVFLAPEHCHHGSLVRGHVDGFSCRNLTVVAADNEDVPKLQPLCAVHRAEIYSIAVCLVAVWYVARYARRSNYLQWPSSGQFTSPRYFANSFASARKQRHLTIYTRKMLDCKHPPRKFVCCDLLRVKLTLFSGKGGNVPDF